MSHEEFIEAQMRTVRRLVYESSQRALRKEREFNIGLMASIGFVSGMLLVGLPILIALL